MFVYGVTMKKALHNVGSMLAALLALVLMAGVLAAWDSFHPIDWLLPKLGNALDDMEGLALGLLTSFHVLVIVSAILIGGAMLAYKAVRALARR